MAARQPLRHQEPQEPPTAPTPPAPPVRARPGRSPTPTSAVRFGEQIVKNSCRLVDPFEWSRSHGEGLVTTHSQAWWPPPTAPSSPCRRMAVSGRGSAAPGRSRGIKLAARPPGRLSDATRCRPPGCAGPRLPRPPGAARPRPRRCPQGFDRDPDDVPCSSLRRSSTGSPSWSRSHHPGRRRSRGWTVKSTPQVP